jgi:hypothetical protein
MKKSDTQIQTPTKQIKLCQRTKWGPQELPEINQNFRDDTGYGQPKCTGDTQEIPRQQKFEKAQEG